MTSVDLVPPAVAAAPEHEPAPAPARAHPNAILAVIGAGALAVLTLWWLNTPLVHGLGGWLTNAGRITGLLAGYGVLVLVALMARFPPLERGIGADRLARWHAMGGRYTVSLVVTHGLLIIWGYAVTTNTGVVEQTGSLLMSYEGVLAGTVAGLLLVGVGISSARAARRRLRYETWYYLHFYTYVAVALALSHQVSTGAEFVDNAPARVVWTGLYIAVGVAILWYRLLTPIGQAARHRLRVAAVYPEGPGVVSVVITGQHLDELRAEPGQFFRWRFLDRGMWWVSAPYSLSAPVRGDQMRITVKALGDHSRAIAALRPGVRVLAEGPYGALTAAVRRQRKVLLIAGGVGITPLRTLFETIPAGPGELTLLYRASQETDVVFRDELERLARQRGATLWIITGRRTELGGDPLTGLSARRPDLAEYDVYLCGPPGLTSTARTVLRDAGVPRRQIHHESFEF